MKTKNQKRLKMDEKKWVDKFVGWVNDIDGDKALLMFKNSAGEEFSGMYDAAVLAEKGITCGKNFDCQVFAVKGEIVFDFSLSSYQGPTPEERMAEYLKLKEELEFAEMDED